MLFVEERNLEEDDALIRIGFLRIGFLKICVSAFDIKSDSEATKKNSLSKNVKNIGVEKVLVLAIAPDIPEN